MRKKYPKLISLLNEDFGVNRINEGRMEKYFALGPWAGELYHQASKRNKSPEPEQERPMYKHGYGDNSSGYSEVEARHEREKFERDQRSAEVAENEANFPGIIANRLYDQYRIPANPNSRGGINIKHKGELHHVGVDGQLSLGDAFDDVFQQIVAMDPELAIRRSASKRRMRHGEESIVVDDEMMEGLSRGSLYRKRYYGRY
jgi:hypothetical protein